MVFEAEDDGSVVECDSERSIAGAGTRLEKGREGEVVGAKAGLEEGTNEDEGLVKEGGLDVGGEENIPGVQVSAGHSVEDLAGEVEVGAAGVHEEEVGLEGGVGKEAMGDGPGVGLLSGAERGERRAASQEGGQPGRKTAAAAPPNWHLRRRFRIHIRTPPFL